MKLTPRKISVIIAICLIGLAACSNLSNGPEVQPVVLPYTQVASLIPNTGELCNNPLYPVRQGASWAYINSGGPNGTFAYSDTISSVRMDGFTITSQIASLTRTQEWACEAGGLKALELGGGTTANITAQGITAEFTTSDITGISLPAVIASGQQWNYDLKIHGSIPMPTEQQAESTGTYSIIMQEIGWETVTVPAGTFDAVKIQANSTVEILVPFGNEQVPMKYTGASITWYAPGVGYVKLVENWDLGGGPYTATTELQTYMIP